MLGSGCQSIRKLCDLYRGGQRWQEGTARDAFDFRRRHDASHHHPFGRIVSGFDDRRGFEDPGALVSDNIDDVVELKRIGQVDTQCLGSIL